MFTKEPYQYKEIGKFPLSKKEPKTFKTSYKFQDHHSIKYIVDFVSYDGLEDFFIVAFYTKSESKNLNKFSHRTGANNLLGVLSTIFAIFDSIIEKAPMSCFGFVGAPDDPDLPDQHPSKRYRVWSKALRRKFIKPQYQYLFQEKSSRGLVACSRRDREDVRSMLRILSRE